MHQFAFVQKCPALTCTALLPPPLNVQLTLSGEKVNMSTAPYTVVSMVLVVTEVSLLHTWLPRFSRGWLSWLVVVFQWFSLVPWFSWFPWLVCVFSVVLFVSVVLDVLVVSVVGVVTIRCSFSAVDQSDSEDDYSTICRNVSYCEQQSFSRPHSLGRSFPPTLDTDIYFHLFQYSGSFKVTLSCSKSISWQIFLMYKNLHCF